MQCYMSGLKHLVFSLYHKIAREDLTRIYNRRGRILADIQFIT